jgi:hypothetical protein
MEINESELFDQSQFKVEDATLNNLNGVVRRGPKHFNDNAYQYNIRQ